MSSEEIPSKVMKMEKKKAPLLVPEFGPLKGIVVPKFSKTPGKVWRGFPALGQGTETILKKLLDYSDEEIKMFKEKKII
ncbi:MAG: hypothetical protein B7O98_01550 [Zestosphaera tikiterensis]|uniref:CoA transferase n=1 Tax=Zestosphaera tikiterensis TaxID=1973259 RepID=A0A2R7Y757_9CREN|nr:MAG: hypothetical protein B7O98_01550 [Zestosphaera tikiterensis]